MFLYNYQFYKGCFEPRRVCGLMTSLYQYKVACVAPTGIFTADGHFFQSSNVENLGLINYLDRFVYKVKSRKTRHNAGLKIICKSTSDDISDGL